MYSYFRFINRILSPTGARARLSILIFHRVLPQPDPLLPDIPDAQRFEKLMQAVNSTFTVLPMEEAIQRMQLNTLPASAACITFDDGYADNATVALPILKKLNLPALFFISPGYLNGGRMWNDTIYETVRRLPQGEIDLTSFNLPVVNINDAISRRYVADGVITAIKHLPPHERDAQVDKFSMGIRNLPNDLMMTDTQVQQLATSGMGIGAHTMTHPILAKTDNTQAEEEIRGSRAYLENLLDRPIDFFAYPNGKPIQDYLPQHVEMVKKSGFKAAVSTSWGVAHAHSDLFQLPRFTPWDISPIRFLARMTLNLRNIG